MADHPQAKTIAAVGSIVIMVLILCAAMFGMGEWKSAPPTTAAAPLPPATITR